MLSKLIEDALNENVIDDSINENEDTNLSSLWYSFHSYEYGYFPCHPSNSDLKSKTILPRLTMRHFERAISQSKASSGKEDLKTFADWTKSFGTQGN